MRRRRERSKRGDDAAREKEEDDEEEEQLEPEDLVAVDIPSLDPEMRCLVVTGTSRETRGIMFYGSRDQFERFRRNPPTMGKTPRMWIVAFDPIDYVPFADVDAWEDLTLSVAAVDAYPRPGLVLPTDRLVRPDSRRLAHLEAILRALSATTDDEFDAGEWSRHVDTAEGSVKVRLSLPRLLEQIAGTDDSNARRPKSEGGSQPDIWSAIGERLAATAAAKAVPLSRGQRAWNETLRLKDPRLSDS